MNFLAHYYFDKVEGDPYHNLGLILPDLVRNFVKGSKFQYESKPQSSQAQSLLNGCLTHIKSDKIFHEWDGFLDSMDRIIEDIRKANLGIRKDWFVAHIFSELILDHVLIENNSQLASSLYSDYEQVEMKPLKEFLDSQNFNRFDLFLNGFDAFMQKKYLLSYKQKDSILYALGKICTKMRLPAFTEEQLILLENIMLKETKCLELEVPRLKRVLS